MHDNTRQSTYVSWARGVREVPDMLAAAQLSLRPLAKGETVPTSAEGRRIVGDACNLLRVALENLVEVTRSLPEFPLASGDSRVSRHAARDPRMSPRVDGILDVDARRTEQCALTQPISRAAFESPDAMTHLTVEQLDRLRRCANGNTLRFEASDIVEALVDAGYATEGVGRVVTVTPKGHRYLLSHPA